jgi:hypothetical protein
MYLCVECGHETKHLLRRYGASIESGHVRLVACKSCKKDVDKYLEYESVLLAVDLVLHRTGAYRHLLLNRISDKRQRLLDFSTSPFQSTVSNSGDESIIHRSQTPFSEIIRHESIVAFHQGIHLYEGGSAFIILVLIDGYARLYRTISAEVFLNGKEYRTKITKDEFVVQDRCELLQESNSKTINNRIKSVKSKCSSCGPYGPDILFPELDVLVANNESNYVINSSSVSRSVETLFDNGKGLRYFKLIGGFEFEDYFVQVDSVQVLASGGGLRLNDFLASIEISLYEWLARILLVIFAVRLFGALSTSRIRSSRVNGSWRLFFSSLLTNLTLSLTLSYPITSSKNSSPATIYSTTNEASRHQNKTESEPSGRPFFLIPQWSEQENIATQTTKSPLINQESISNSKSSTSKLISNSSVPHISPSLHPSPKETWLILSAILTAACVGRCLLLTSLIFPFPPLLLTFTVSFISFTSTTCALRAALDCSILTSALITVTSSIGTFLLFEL